MWLLLIGIDFYLEKENRLHGAVNDVSDLELSLEDHFKDIKVVKFVAPTTGDPNQTSPPGHEDLWPTRANLTAAVKKIAREATADELVYFHYSGHGTLRPTADSGFIYQEDYGADAALVLHEPGAQHGVRYLFGFELAMLLDELVRKDLRLTVVLDACHSGSISRHEDDLVRSMPWNDAVASEFPLPERPTLEHSTLKESQYRDANPGPHWLLRPRGYALWAACGPHERAKELRLGKKRYNGALSYHILEALDFCARNQILDITHEEMHRRVCAKMYSKEIGQNPVLLGTRRSTFLRSHAIDQDMQSTHTIIKVSEQEIWLNVGLIHGSCIGDEYLIFSDAKATHLVARTTVADVHALHSIATRSPDRSVVRGTEQQVKAGYTAIIAKLAEPRAHVKLSPQMDDTLADMLAKSVWLERKPSHELASMTAPLFSVVLKDGQQYAILDSHGDPIQHLPFSLISNYPAVIFALEHLAKFAFVQSLSNRRTISLLASSFAISASSRVDRSNPLTSDDRITIPHKTMIDIEFRNLTPEILYFAVLNLTQLRRIKHLYPAHKEYQFILPSDTHRVLPRELARDIRPSATINFALRMTVPAQLQDWQKQKRARGRITAEDELKFIVSTRPVHGTREMELPDLWDAVEQGETDDREKLFGAEFCQSLVDGDMGPSTLREETVPVRWASRSIKVCTVLEMG